VDDTGNAYHFVRQAPIPMPQMNETILQSSHSRLKIFLKRGDQNTRLWAGLFVILFLLSGILTLHNYGLTWDEGLGNLFFGERYFRYLTSFSREYLDFNADLKHLSNYPLHLYLSPFHDRPNEFPPLADTLSAATMYLFAYRLKWLNPIDGFHLFTVFLAAIFLWVVFRFVEFRLGKFTALMAIFFLGTFPRFWADMHFNVKDVPETIFFGLVIMAFWHWYERPAWHIALGTGILMGCTLSIKANAIFIPLILLVCVLPLRLSPKAVKDTFVHFKKYLWHYAIMGVSSVSVYILSWPYLYTHTFLRLKSYWAYIFSQGSRNGGSHWNIDPLRQVLTTIPEFMLIAFGFGFLLVLRQVWRAKSPFWRLLLLWAIFPVLRASLPGAVNFDGIRHFLEFVPAVAIIAGYGVSRIGSLFAHKQHLPKVTAQIGILILLIINLFQINRQYYPYLHLYYNEFTGGLAGARDKFLGMEASDYWASSYRQGMEWLNQNAPTNSTVSGLIAPWIVELSGSVLLRPDIHVISVLPDFSVMRQAQDPYYLMFILRDGGSSQDEIVYTRKRGELVHQINVDGVPILEIYRFGGN
jgi:hypothetical protein